MSDLQQTDVFISYRRTDRPIAAALAARLTELNLNVWFDQELRIGDKWHWEISNRIARSKTVVALWSEETLKSPWVLAEIEQAFQQDTLVSALIGQYLIPVPYNILPAVDLIGWPKTQRSQDAFWILIEKLGERLKRRDLLEFALRERLLLAEMPRERKLSEPSLKFFDFSEMLHMCEQVRDEVREFDPDIMISLDARCGLWAEMLFDWLQRRVPVIIGYRVNTGNLDDRNSLPGFIPLTTDRGTAFIPEVITRLPRNNKILLVNDYSPSGTEEESFTKLLCDTFSFSELSVKTLTLIVSSEAKRRLTRNAAFSTQEASTDFIAMFYENRSIPFNIHASGDEN